MICVNVNAECACADAEEYKEQLCVEYGKHDSGGLSCTIWLFRMMATIFIKDSSERLLTL